MAMIESAAKQVVRGTIDCANTVIAWLRRGRRINPETASVRVNLGSALAVAPGWIHIDASPSTLLAGRNMWVQALAYRFIGSKTFFDLDEYRRRLNEYQFVHHDLAYGIPFHDASVDFVFSSHFLEHLCQAAAVRLLRDSYRVLRAGGVIRTCVPDLEKAVQLYLHGERESFLNYFFTDERLGRHRHRYMYDFETLRAALSAAGFVEVTRCEYRSGRTPDLDFLDNRSDETLYVEAIRPP
jgi:predicted SAM-dependent methyltransferase